MKAQCYNGGKSAALCHIFAASAELPPFENLLDQRKFRCYPLRQHQYWSCSVSQQKQKQKYSLLRLASSRGPSALDLPPTQLQHMDPPIFRLRHKIRRRRPNSAALGSNNCYSKRTVGLQQFKLLYYSITTAT